MLFLNKPLRMALLMRLGDEVASCSQDKTILTWSLRQGSPIRRLRGHAGPVYCLDSRNDVLASG